MKKIPKEIYEDVNKIINKIILYKNKKNLSWIGVYKDVLDKLNMQDKKEDPKLLINVVKEITRLGYDITDNPFKLNKFL